MTIIYHRDVIQGSEEWRANRCGILTGSEMKLIVTPTGKQASNDKERAHLFELMAQRITGYVEPGYISDDMIRGHEDEVVALGLYAEHYSHVEECGFITNNSLGFKIGYSPDGLVGDDGLIECKSRCQKHQAATIVAGEVPAEYMLQLQTGLLVTGRAWIDFVSYCGGMPMFVKRVLPDAGMQEAIVEAATSFEKRLQEALNKYSANSAGMILTERKSNLLEE